MKKIKNLEVMRDLPIELIRYNNDNPEQIIFDEKYFIKKVSSACDIETLSSLCNLDIEGFNNHKKIFIDENEIFIYLVAPYLKAHKDLSKEILTMSPKDIITLFRIMLERLIPANQQDFNPYDIRYSNYLLDENKQPIFTNFAFCYYKEKGSYGPFIPSFDFEKQNSLKDNLLLHDKMEVLKLFLQSMSSSFDLDNFLKSGTHNLYDFLAYFYNNLKEKYVLPQEVDEYLSDLIFKKMVPKEDDYFIEHLIDPLEKGLELKL